MVISPDRRTIIQIFGGLMEKPSLLNDTDKYSLEPSDFHTQLDKYIFTAIYNLYVDGATKIHSIDVDNYLQNNSLAKNLLEKENGIKFLIDCESYSDEKNFDYYYKKLKKFNLLRDLQKSGKDISQFYSTDPMNPNHQKINDNFEKMSTDDILNKLKGQLASLENRYLFNNQVEESTAFDGIKDLLEDLRFEPEVGCKLQGEIFNTITRGARKGKMYLRSAASGTGKSRSMVGDACYMAYPIRYEPAYGQWISTGSCERVLYVMTEQDPSEIQTMILSYLTGYNEEMFLYGTYKEEHMPRIRKALDIMEKYKDNMLFARIPDPCSSIVKNLFRRYNLQFGVENFFYDYIFSSPAMLNEYRDLGVREDICLRLFTTTLKNLAIELNSFIMTSTQISNDDGLGGFKDYQHIRGSRAIVDLVDFACIMSRPTPEELKEVIGFKSHYDFQPNMITDVFKNRRGRWTMVRIWSKVDLGTCRSYNLFVTTPDLKPIEDFQIVDFISEKTEEMRELEEYYNDGIIPPDFSMQEKAPTIVMQNIYSSVQEAFEEEENTKRRLKEVSISELL